MTKIQSLISGLPAYLLFFFAPLTPLVVTVIFLVFTDLLTGIKAAKKQGEQIRSRKLFKTLEKALIHFTLILLSRLMELYIIPGIPVVNLLGGFIAIYEFKSILENYKIITGIDLIKFFHEKIKRY